MSKKISKVIPAQIDLPKVEQEILSFWDNSDIFQKSVASRAGAPSWSFYEGPPTANGLPGTHHIEARVFKDLFPRYQTMKGKQVIRKAGWDCHGLPVEIAVEKEMGLSGKGDIEKIAGNIHDSIIEFNKQCRQSVVRHVDAFTNMTRRMGFWVDFDSAYWTMSSEYIESVWWSLKQIWKKGLLVQDFRVAPYCPRCGTGLSDHELAQGYETVTDPSVYVGFEIADDALNGKLKDTQILVWTTTPWTLVSNTAIAVNPEIKYHHIEVSDDAGELPTKKYLIASGLEDILKKYATNSTLKILDTFLGSDLENLKYKPILNIVEIPDAHFIILADYVTAQDGTGFVHQAPAFGADDFTSCRKYGLPVINPILPNGHFENQLDLVGGLFFKDANKIINKALRSAGNLFLLKDYEHSYPHCWRCHTALIYYAQPAWYIRTTAIKDQLLAENEKTNWHPQTIKNGRFGDWLNNNIDWSLSRNRYWGTPLPIWRCVNKHEVCIESLSELSELTGKDLTNIDPHRPYVDAYTFNCAECNEQMIRTVEVIDCWYDSGAMPFAQWGYPHKEGSREIFESRYPADYICEAIDQTRGWFYTLMAIGTLVFEQSSYKTVLCLGHILDKDGRKMSKHLGNVLEPMALMDQHGADAVRWYMLAAGSPWSARRVGHEAITEVVRKVLLTYWNTVSFFTIYAKAAEYELQDFNPNSPDLTMMDKWIVSELHSLIAKVDESYENYDSQIAGKDIANFIDDLSNWYIRRNRRRFWDGDQTALSLLYYALKQVSLLMTPMIPFITEHLWQTLVIELEPNESQSIHLANFPTSDKSLIDLELMSQIRLTRRLVELGRAARAESKLKIRQPLSRALIGSQEWKQISEDARKYLRAEICEELNVIAINEITSQDSDLVNITIKANFKSLGERYGKNVQEIAKFIASSEALILVTQLRTNPTHTISVGENNYEITLDDLVVTEIPKSGWSYAAHDGESIALDLTLTPELIEAGLVREIIRTIQEGRKNAGLDVSDRILITYFGNAEIVKAVTNNLQNISDEVLAKSITLVDSISDNAAPFVLAVAELDFTFTIIKSV